MFQLIPTHLSPLSTCSWDKFSAGWLVGGLSGVAWCYVLTQVLPYYSVSGTEMGNVQGLRA